MSGEGSLFARARMVCHCLLIEGPRGLMLVDTGLGVADVRSPVERLGKRWVRSVLGPRAHEEECAVRQVERLGFKPADVRDILLTHLDLDHAGGLTDFPSARVHVLRDEQASALGPRQFRYRPTQWEHTPDWITYSGTSGEHWFGFEGVQQPDGLPPEVLLVPLRGHSRGHTGVAVKTEQGWLLHAGDAYFHHGEVDPARPRVPLGLRYQTRRSAADREAMQANVARLRALVAQQRPDVTVFCAHSPVEYDRCLARSTQVLAQPMSAMALSAKITS